MKHLFLIFTLLFLVIGLNGQYTDPKFGKIDPADLSMIKYDKDTTAGALMLFDYGESAFTLTNDADFQFVYNRHCQIKIFKKSSFPITNISIRLYKNSTRRENLLNLKAVTYNLVDGNVVKTKLDKDKIYRAEGRNYTDVKFAFPEIKEGSIIELSYGISSDFLYNLRGWTFQYSFPARWSQYFYSIPEYFHYRELSKGYLNFDINKKEDGTTFFSLPGGYAEVTPRGTREVLPNQNIRATETKSFLAIKDIPAFISEPNIDCEDNYKQSIEFELSSIQFPNSVMKNYTETWESVNKEMSDDEDFGGLLKSDGFIRDTVEFLCKNKSTEMDKAIAVYNYIQKQMKWNEVYRLWSTKSLKKTFIEKTGSSSDINLLLTLMLRTAGLKANPVMFSTRDNGVANTNYPTITKFNSVLTEVEIGGKQILLDGISKYCPFGVIPANDINGKGRVMNDQSGDWVNLNTNDKYVEKKIYTMDINPDGKLTGSLTENYDGYAGIMMRYSLDSEKSTDDYFRKIQEGQKGLTINKYSIANRDNDSKPISDSLNIEVTDHSELIGDKIMFNPLLFETIERNKYTLEDRKYPVDYNYPITEIYTFNYTLPEGYKVESMPQPATIKLPDNSILVNYRTKNEGNKVIVEYRREIDKILFLPDEYKKLKDLYDQIVKKHSEQIILKKV